MTIRSSQVDAQNEAYLITTKYYLESLIINLKLQPPFSPMLSPFVLLMTIALITFPAEAQPSFNGEKKLLDVTTFFFLDQFEYTFDIDGTQIFPNDTLKNNIVTEYKKFDYNISSLQYKIMDHNINASGVQIYVEPTRIDDTKTRLNIEIFAHNAEVTGQWVNRSYNNLELRSVYAVYDKISDKITIHIPYSVALSLLLQ